MTISRGRTMLLNTLSEAEFQRHVIDLAHRNDWLVHHVHDSRKEEWGTDAGLPDLVLARGGRVLFVELKAQRGRLAAAQQVWANVLKGTDAEYYLWRPSDEAEIELVLS